MHHRFFIGRERMRQIELIKNINLKFFGGSLLKGKRKSLRPLSNRHPIHLVMRSEKAKGRASFFRFKRLIEGVLNKNAKKFGVRIYHVAIQSNHIHLILRIFNRQTYRKFICALTGTIAHLVSRGAGLKKQNRSFWVARPFTRIITWGREYRYVVGYLLQNKLEAIGFISYKQRIDYYSRLILSKGETSSSA